MEELNHRGAGILLHITSLPGPAYIGDIGKSARDFADFLHRSNQVVWQMLPVQPLTPEQAYSPYSSYSSMAGNLLLISPEQLSSDGLIDKKELIRRSAGQQVDYNRAKKYKEALIDKAWIRWKKNNQEREQYMFTDFCSRESYWLNDFALYSVLKHEHKNAPWYQWPEKFKKRNKAALNEFATKHQDDLRKVKWSQMLFDRQWKALRDYCASQQVMLLGDVPIYVAHDSSDVWSNPEYFTLKEDGTLKEVAGVPPDLFNADGQLWGMPLFKWDVLKKSKYDWWLKRFRKNLEWFDILRLDHFRGFSSYWSVPAESTTAKNGRWIPGPGTDFFNAIRAGLGSLPFVAEDLGEIDQPVYLLRDEQELPGMNVLQFAFGDDMPRSEYLPHHHKPNSIVYTGTHDNNTSVGWFNESDKVIRNNLSGYTGTKITSRNIAEQMIRLAYMSVSNLAIIPMQDVLSLDAGARMNTPATAKNNWQWRLEKNQLSKEVEQYLATLCFYYNRSRKIE